MSVIDTLITDRTSTDVSRATTLNAKGYASMTTAERTEWLAGLKGSYNAADLNRVGQAVTYLANRLNGYGYAVTVSVKTDWQTSDIPTSAQMTTYLANISLLRSAISLPSSTPSVPSDMDGLTYTEANNIEEILTVLETYITNMVNSFVPCGQPYCGVIWTQLS